MRWSVADSASRLNKPLLIINADDWGRSVEETDAALTCFNAGAITSVSAMVYMKDSERAARIARDRNFAVGLHLNLVEAFSGPDVPADLRAAQGRIAAFLRRSKYSVVVYHPLLRSAFHQVYRAQAAEFIRLYGRPPTHVDGHLHMHLCLNVLLGNVIPTGERVRRSFSFVRGEKSVMNRTYRRLVDWRLGRRHRLTDHFFSLADSLQPERMNYVANLARSSTVELMTHPVYAAEQSFLLSEQYIQLIQSLTTGSYAQL